MIMITILVAGLGENQDTEDKRLDSYKKGYMRGQPDLLVLDYHKDYKGVGQAVLDTVHVTNFVQSHHCRWRTDSFTFALVVSSIFFDFRRLSSDLR